jgi:transposase-like protein
MSNQKKWSYEIKIEICKRLISGQSYSSVSKEFNCERRWMLANW